MMRIQFLFILLFSFQTFASTEKCEQLFSLTNQSHVLVYLTPEQTNAIMKATEQDKDSTTGARVEGKNTTKVTDFNQLINLFKKDFAAEAPDRSVVNRDPVTEGKRNVTWTAYSNRFLLVLSNGKELITKIRLRKYGLNDIAKLLTKENFITLDWLKEVSFFEFKIENPEAANSVLKPRVIIFDQDADSLLNPKLTLFQLKEIYTRTLFLNRRLDQIEQSKVDETVYYMLLAIRKLHAGKSHFAPEFETLYERTSFVAPLKIKGSDKIYEVQITQDTHITTHSLVHQQDAQIYKNHPNVSVNEIKIPIPLLKYIIVNPDGSMQPRLTGLYQTSQVEGLTAVLVLKQRLEQHHLKDSFQMNSGKIHHTRIELDGPRPF